MPERSNNQSKDVDVAIIICSEAGQLARESLMLVESIRQYGGVLRRSKIYSISPRADRDIPDFVKKKFREYDVNHRHLVVNREFDNYGIANKVLACAYFESTLENDYLLFLDSDQVVFNCISPLFSGRSFDLAIAPVFWKGIGTNGYDANTELWHRLYNRFGIQKARFTRSRLDNQLIYKYYNTGFILARRINGLFANWLANLRSISAYGQNGGRISYFLDQVALAVTVSSLAIEVFEIPMEYNYPGSRNREVIRSGTWLTLDDIKTFHYMDIFRSGNGISASSVFPNLSGERFSWFADAIVRNRLHHQPFVEEPREQRLRNRLQWKLRLNAGDLRSSLPT